MNEETKEINSLVASHEIVMGGYWKTIKDKLYEKMEEKTSLLDVDDRLTPEQTIVEIRASKKAVLWVQDWIREVEAEAEGFALEQKEERDNIVRY